MSRRSGLITLLAVVNIIGALNWGLIGFFNWNLVTAIFGGNTAEMASMASRIVYALVGLAGLGLAVLLPRLRTHASVVEETGRREPPRRRPEPPQPQA